MAVTVTNKTQKPLSIPLGRGKTLYIGPGKSGEIAANDVEHPAVKTLIDGGTIAIGEARGRAGGGGGGGRPAHGYPSSGGRRRGGDR